MDTSTITALTPMTMPNVVSRDRSLLPATMREAIIKLSRSEGLRGVTIVLSTKGHLGCSGQAAAHHLSEHLAVGAAAHDNQVSFR